MLSVNSLTVIKYSSKGIEQTARMRRLVRAFASRTYHIDGNLMSQLKFSFLALNLLDDVLILLINVKMQTIVGILTFISRIHFMLC